jgi:hypothetical protein
VSRLAAECCEARLAQMSKLTEHIRSASRWCRGGPRPDLASAGQGVLVEGSGLLVVTQPARSEGVVVGEGRRSSGKGSVNFDKVPPLRLVWETGLGRGVIR